MRAHHNATRVEPVINRALKIAMLDRGLTLRRMSRAARVEYTKCSRIVNGEVRPTEKERERIAKVIGQPAEWIFDPEYPEL